MLSQKNLKFIIIISDKILMHKVKFKTLNI